MKHLLQLVALALATAGVLSACTTDGTPTSDEPDRKVTSGPVTVDANVANGATDVRVDTVVTATATNSAISVATLKSTDGKQRISGRVRDGRWTADERLEPGVTYRLAAVAESGDAKKLVRTFTTQPLTLDQQTYPALAPLDGETVGVGMPIVVTFDIGVKDRAAFEKRMHVTASKDVEGSWSWLSDKEVHYRPKAFWPANTTVTVQLDLNSIPAGNGIYGQQDQRATFKVGRRAVTTVDVGGSKLSYWENGKKLRTIPMSAGAPQWPTRKGVKVIMEKYDTVDMDAASTGVDSSDPNYYNMKGVKWAMRVTTSGEFLHAAPWNSGRFGRVNVSHGCVGMSTADASWLYHRSRRGDVVKFVNSPRGLEERNGWTDWNVGWDAWTKGSALEE